MIDYRFLEILLTNRLNFRIIEKNNGKAPLTYHQFQAIIASMDPPPPAEPTINLETVENTRTPVHDDHDETYGVPTLDELGFDTEGLKPPVWIGGETEALGERLGVILLNQELINIFCSSTRAPLGAQGVGGELWPAENVTAVAARESNRPLALSPLRLPIDATFLLPTDRSL